MADKTDDGLGRMSGAAIAAMRGPNRRTDAHPVTVEMLKRWASLANDTPMTKTYRNHLLSEIRTAIAKMKEPNNDAG